MEGNAGGMGDVVGPSMSYGEIMAQLFREKVGLSAEDALKAAQLTQGLIDTSQKAAMTSTERIFETRLEEERQRKRKRKTMENESQHAIEALSPRQKEKSLMLSIDVFHNNDPMNIQHPPSRHTT